MTIYSSLARLSGAARTALVLTTMPALLLVQSAAAQTSLGRSGMGAGQAAQSGPSDKDTREYDKHDFNGLWARSPEPFHQPACPECRDNGPISYGFFGEVPPRTPEGEKKFQLNKPSKGFEAGTPQALAHAVTVSLEPSEGLSVQSPEQPIELGKVEAGTVRLAAARLLSTEVGTRVLRVRVTLDLPAGTDSRVFACPVVIVANTAR